jgi:hypothetical protein
MAGLGLRNNTFLKIFLCVAAGLILLVILAAIAGQSIYHSVKGYIPDIGLNVSNISSTETVGLPVYPGARPYRIEDNESSGGDTSQNNAANVWAMAGKSGFKVSVIRFTSDDPPGKIVAFYRSVLAQFGPVAECSATSDAKDGENGFDCNGDDRAPGHVALKSGTKPDLHIAAIKPNADGKGSELTLVYLRIKGIPD